MYEENLLDEAYASQGTTPHSLPGVLIMFASTQGDLQKRYRDILPPDKDSTYNIRMAFPLAQEP